MRRASILLLLLAPALALAEGPDAATKARFAELSKSFDEVKRSSNWEEIKKRRDLINELGDLDHPGVPKLLHQCFVKDREQICRIPAMVGLGKQGGTKALRATVTEAVRDRNDVYVMCLPLIFAHSKNEEIGPWLVRNLLKQKKNTDLRAAVIQSLGLLKEKSAYELLVKTLTRETRDLRALYECLIAVARIGGPEALPVITPFLEHKERTLREGAVVALGETGSDEAVALALPLAKDVCPRTQEAVAGVILEKKAEAGLPTLIALLRTGRLRVMDTARNCLEKITGEKHGLDADAWELWLKKKATGELPEKPEVEPAGSYATYYGMRVFSDRILFILDVSGSMNAGKPMRIETARAELKKTLLMLNEKTQFNIVGFSGATMAWRDSLVPASKKNVAEAIEFVEKLDTGGGTNVYDTFEQAFEENALMDTIFFLGDGSPSVGRHTEQEEILARLRWMNRARKVRIHTIALIRGKVARFGGRMGPGLGRGRSASGDRAYDEDKAARFLERLAHEHGGSFILIDK